MINLYIFPASYEILFDNCEFETDMCNWKSENENIWTRDDGKFSIETI